MATSVHSDDEEDQLEETEPGEDGYWPALEILNERKHDYLVHWDGVNPETGRAWTPSWTAKTEVTEDLIEAWQAKKAAKKKRNRRAPNKPKKSRVAAAPTPKKPATRSSRSSRTPLMSSSRATDSPVISIASDNSSRASGEHALGKRKRRNTRHTPADEDPKPVPKKQRVNVTPSPAPQRSRTTSVENPKQISRQTIYEEDEGGDPVEVEGPEQVSRTPSTSKAGAGSAIVRIGPPRRRKKIAPLPPPATPPPYHGSNSAHSYPREEEEENTQEAAGIVPRPVSSPPTVKKKKRRLKPASDIRPRIPTPVAEDPPASPLQNYPEEPQEPSDQEEPFKADPSLPDQDGEHIEPLPEPTPPRAARHRSLPTSPVSDDISTPVLPRVQQSTNALGPVPRMNPSNFKPYLQVADTTSVIDEFSPKKSFPTQDTIEASVQGSQDRRTAPEHLHQTLDPVPVDDPLDVDIVQKMQDVQDTYFDFDGRANEVSNQGQLITDPGSTEQYLPRSQSPSEHANTPAPVQLFNSQKLEDALMILNQKSEEIEDLESRLATQEAQIEHLQAENHRIQVESENFSVTHAVQREALEEAKGTVTELGVHIDYLQDSLDKSEAEVKQLQGEMDEVRDLLNAKVEEHTLTRAEWEQERDALNARLASLEDRPSQQPLVDWELEKAELEGRLAEVTEERDQLSKDKQYAENEAESWREEYRKAFMESQQLRQEAKDAKTETSRIQEEKEIVASQTKEGVRLITAKYEAVVEKLETELAKAESLYKVLQAKDEQTGDNIRRRAVLATNLQEEVRRLHEELASEQAKEVAIELKCEERYVCQFFMNGVRCDQVFHSPQELWSHAAFGGHPRFSRNNDE